LPVPEKPETVKPDTENPDTYKTNILPLKIKEEITTTNCSSSYFFSEILDRDFISQKIELDNRTNEEFLSSIKEHVENHSDIKFPYMQRAQAALKLLKKLKSLNEIFYVTGKQPIEGKIITKITETPEQRADRYRKEKEVWKNKP